MAVSVICFAILRFYFVMGVFVIYVCDFLALLEWVSLKFSLKFPFSLIFLNTQNDPIKFLSW